MKIQPSRLKLIAYLLGGAGMIVASEIQKREIREAVEETVAKRMPKPAPTEQ